MGRMVETVIRRKNAEENSWKAVDTTTVLKPQTTLDHN